MWATHQRFNPSVGILLVGTKEIGWAGPPVIVVSIPRSGFCWLGREKGGSHAHENDCFNPSVGILLVGTKKLRAAEQAGRQVSIPRSGFCWLGPKKEGYHHVREELVSIPRSGFCWLGPSKPKSRGRADVKFQSLGRDSVGWEGPRDQYTAWSGVVSIPRSGFCWLGPSMALGPTEGKHVSIPRSGFCWLGP